MKIFFAHLKGQYPWPIARSNVERLMVIRRDRKERKRYSWYGPSSIKFLGKIQKLEKRERLYWAGPGEERHGFFYTHLGAIYVCVLSDFKWLIFVGGVLCGCCIIRYCQSLRVGQWQRLSFTPKNGEARKFWCAAPTTNSRSSNTVLCYVFVTIKFQEFRIRE